MLDVLVSDLAMAARGLVRRPGFAVAALATLALGIGANSAVFSIVNALLLRPLPLGAHGERLVRLHSTHNAQAEDWEDSNLSYQDLQDVGAASRHLEDTAGYISAGRTLEAGGEAERLRGGAVTPNLFELLGVRPVLGRGFREDDAADFGFEPVVLLGYRVFERRFGADPSVVGRTVQLNGRPLTVIGVMPPGMRFPERDELWTAYRPSSAPDRAPARSARFVAGFGRLRPGATLAQLQAELDPLAGRLANEYPDTNRGFGLRAMSFRDSVVGRGERALSATLLLAVVAVLFVGCANLANLILARGIARQRELALRAALGASRSRLVRQTLAEVALLGIAGALLGLLLAGWFLELSVASWPEELPYWVRLELDWRVVLFTAFVATLATLLAGLLPAFRSSRPDLASQLGDGARGSRGSGPQRLQSALVVGQLALCLALLAGASLMIRSFLKLQAAPSGMREEGLLTMRFYVAGDAYDVVERRAELLLGLEDRLRQLPGVASAAFSSSIPTDDGGGSVRLAIDGQPVPPGDEPAAIRIVASAALFETVGAPVVEGRTFSVREQKDATADVVLVNHSLARRFWPGGGAVGRRLALLTGGGRPDNGLVEWLRIVGVVPDLQYEEFGEETAASRLHVYRPYAAVPARSLALIVRARTTPRAQADPVRRVFREIDPGLATWDVRTMDELRAYTTWEQRFFGRLMGGFAAQALLLACLGVYGVLAHAVNLRMREIGVRLALGARPLDVLGLVLRRGMALGAVGVGLGVMLALAVAGVLESLLYGVEPFDPWPLAILSGLLLLVVAAASLLPARRAAAVDPLVSLRAE